MVETNIAFHVIPASDQPRERFRGYWEAAAYQSSNNTSSKEIQPVRQAGGTLMICRDNITHRLIGQGSDPRHLGRWTWMRFQGRQDRTIRIVTIYRPVRSTGPTSVYQQHKAHLYSNDIDTCPREQILLDLHKEISKWKEAGDQILATGDFNDPVYCPRLKQLFDSLDMKELIINCHGPNAPNTSAEGSVPIDGIFATPTLTATRCGYTAMDWGTHSNHRLLWVDFDLSSTLGTELPRVLHPKARRLKLIDPRIVTNFLILRKKYEDTHHLQDRVQQLYSEVLSNSSTLTQFQRIELDSIDCIRTKCILKAELNCRKLRMGHIPWSPSYKEATYKIRYLKSCIRKYRQEDSIGSCNISSRTLQRQWKQAGMITPINTYEAAIEAIKKAYTEYNKIKSSAESLRTTFLQDLASSIAEKDDGNADNIYEQLISRERQQELSRKLRLIRGVTKGSITRVEIPTESGWQEVYEKEDIENGCMEENIRRFTQANATPPLMKDSVELLGWTANTSYSQSILEGTADLNHPLLRPGLQRLIPYLSTPPTIAAQSPISSDITDKEYRYSWTRTKEYTTAGKSGIHFGHMKAGCQDDRTAELDRLLLVIALKTGFSYRRWQTGIDYCIPKKADSIKVTKLRTITFLECDFNQVNKITARRLMQHAENAQTLAPEQYGSRKHKSSILHATNKQLTFDIIRQEKSNAALMVLDAISCYDRIAQTVAALSLRRQGLPQETVDVMLNTLDNMKHYIRTALGDSISYYPSEVRPAKLHGILQGNGAGPMIWAMVSTPILARMRDKGYGVHITHPESHKSITVSAYSFVDDADFPQYLGDLFYFVKTAQGNFDEWLDGLSSTGGDVSGEKSSWYALIHHWTGTRWLISKIDTHPGDGLTQMAHTRYSSDSNAMTQQNNWELCLHLTET